MSRFKSPLSIVSCSIRQSAMATSACRRVSNTCRTRSNASRHDAADFFVDLAGGLLAVGAIAVQFLLAVQQHASGGSPDRSPAPAGSCRSP